MAGAPTIHKMNKSSTPLITVDEALQYTPLTTSLLPTHEQIPWPSVGRTGISSRLVSSAERKRMQRLLGSPLSPDMKEKLAVLLDHNNLMQIEFKSLPVPAHPLASSIDPGVLQCLSPAARAVLQMTDIEYRYPSPDPSPVPQSPPSDVAKHQFVQRKTTPTTFKTEQRNGPVIKSPPSSSHGKILIELPSTSNIRREDYVALPDSPKRRKIEHDKQPPPILHLDTHREKGDAAVLYLQNFLMEIFEMQDRFAPDTSSVQTHERNDIFEPLNEEDESILQLSSRTLDRLHSSIRQVMSFHRLDDIASEHLRRLQQLCEPSIEAAQTCLLRLEAGSSDEDISIWRARLRKAEIGAAAASVFIQTLLEGQRDENAAFVETLPWLPNVLVNIFENCLISITEARPEGEYADLFRHAVHYKDELKKLLDTSCRLLDLLSAVCVQNQAAEVCVNSTEFLAAKLIFVQNSPIDKHSALGLQTYEKVRKQAMVTLAKLYAAFPSERSAILDEVLSSLDKLPSTSRSARHYKTRDGKNIQLITALFMLLVQTTSMENTRGQAKLDLETAEGPKDDESESEADAPKFAVILPKVLHKTSDLLQLQEKSTQLYDGAASSARDIIVYLVGKASRVSKSGDSPYRNVLDLFIEDLINVLRLPDWPASELLLRLLATRMITLANNEKAAMIKSMALESLGTMGSAISALRAVVSESGKHSVEGSSGLLDLSARLKNLAEDQIVTGLRNEDLINLDGPFAIASRFFTSKSGKSLNVQSAKSYFLAQYAKFASVEIMKADANDDTDILDARTSRLVTALLKQLQDPNGSSALIEETEDLSTADAELAYLLSILNLGFCRQFGTLIKTLSDSLSSDQAQVRSRSLKSIVTMLETDPNLLDRDPTIADDVFRCASDDSAMVRDSALSLIAKFVISKPALEEKGIKRLLECAADAKIAVQKRAIGHLKELYIQDHRPGLRAAIAQTVLRRTGDHEETVADLARKTLFDAWMSPNLDLIKKIDNDAKAQVSIEDLSSLIVQTVAHDVTDLKPLLKDFLTWSMKSSQKSVTLVPALVGQLAESLFQLIVSGSATQAALTTLMALAEVVPKSIVPQQLSTLRRYLSNISTEEDLFMFKSVIGIFRHVLPCLSATHTALLKDIQDDLMKSINKLARRLEMDEVMSCLRTIDEVLQNTVRLVKLTISVVNQISSPNTAMNVKVKLIRIAGAVGKNLDLESQKRFFEAEVKTYKGGPVSGFMAQALYPFALTDQPIAIRLIALESLGSICQAWPAQFNKTHIRDALFQVFDAEGQTSFEFSDIIRMQLVVLRMLEELYAIRALLKSDPDSDQQEGQVQELGKIGGSSKTQGEDSAISAVTPKVVEHVLRIALSEQGEKALLATKTLASISHQGMIHPRESTGAFVALETSMDARISTVASKAHRLLHQQHESVCEREYIGAVHQAFKYQKTVYSDPSGASIIGFKPKLATCFEILNTSGSKYVKKFMSTLITRVNTDLAKLDISQTIPDHLLFVRFVVQNLAFFDYVRMEDLLHTILQLELSFSKNGGEIVQVIEANPALQAEIETSLDPTDISVQTCDPVLLQRLATAACAVTLVSEARSHLRRQYGITRDVKATITHSKQNKEASKAPLKVHGITGEKFWGISKSILSSLDNTDSMMTRCREFVKLMAVDEDVHLADDQNLPQDGMSAGLSTEDIAVDRGKKRKSTAPSLTGTPKKRRTSYIGRPRRSASVSSHGNLDDDYVG